MPLSDCSESIRGIIHVVLKHSMLTSMRIYACYAVKTYKIIFLKNKQEWGGGVTGVPALDPPLVIYLIKSYSNV